LKKRKSPTKSNSDDIVIPSDEDEEGEKVEKISSTIYTTDSRDDGLSAGESTPEDTSEVISAIPCIYAFKTIESFSEDKIKSEWVINNNIQRKLGNHLEEYQPSDFDKYNDEILLKVTNEVEDMNEFLDENGLSVYKDAISGGFDEDKNFIYASIYSPVLKWKTERVIGTGLTLKTGEKVKSFIVDAAVYMPPKSKKLSLNTMLIKIPTNIKKKYVYIKPLNYTNYCDMSTGFQNNLFKLDDLLTKYRSVYTKQVKKLKHVELPEVMYIGHSKMDYLNGMTYNLSEDESISLSNSHQNYNINMNLYGIGEKSRKVVCRISPKDNETISVKKTFGMWIVNAGKVEMCAIFNKNSFMRIK